ncbi:unnamed protein product [Spirodela intermedia]|uniref:Bromo domain-containing protein n=1 Tax=Spirodela intermedia TaxID=51605 RepID=A0A7I8KH57_SPIIN|nr:unnamed protein product [Spirodela intermedia]
MKRKRGSKSSNKKGKKKAVTVLSDPASSPSHVNGDEDAGLDERDVSPTNSKNEVELPSVSPDETSNPANSDPITTNEASLSQPRYSRVKVKLKSSRTLEPSKTNIDNQMGETEKGHGKPVLPTSETCIEKKEGSNYSDGRISDLQPTSSGKSPRKAGSIKIISSRVIRPSNVGMAEEYDKANSPLQIKGERERWISDNERTAESSVHIKYRRRDTSAPRVDPRYDENELRTALVVIKKIMKMEAAEPFNAPVDPVALGIPDYFEVIETPMDFGTIRKDLEHGQKYLNSKDIFKDVQFIWENCYKYNNKGDYILDLMKRVKRNFMKYWTAAGLSTDLTGPTESAQAENSTQSGTQKGHVKLKGKSSKPKRKRHGIDLHKSGCLCAVCVVRRRRREREGLSEATERQMEACDDNLGPEFKEEKSYPVENSPSDHTSSSLDQSREPDAIADADEAENEGAVTTPEQPPAGEQVKQEISESEGLRIANTGEEASGHLVDEEPSQGLGQPVEVQEPITGDELLLAGNQRGASADEQLQTLGGLREETEDELMESASDGGEISLYEDPLHQENLAVLQICRTLFSKDSRSVWRGPHSLNRRQALVRHSPIQAALSTFIRR